MEVLRLNLAPVQWQQQHSHCRHRRIWVKEKKNGRSQNVSEVLKQALVPSHRGRHPYPARDGIPAGGHGSCLLLGSWALHSAHLPQVLPPELQSTLFALTPSCPHGGNSVSKAKSDATPPHKVNITIIGEIAGVQGQKQREGDPGS
jgi:hypothetical protein